MTSTLGTANPRLRQLVLEALPEIQKVVEADLRRQELSIPITIGQFRALKAISQGACNVSDVARRQVLTLPTTSRLVDGLVRLRLVDRAVPETDRRQVRLVLTARGRELVDEFQERAGARVDALLERIDREQALALEHSLAALQVAARRFCGAEIEPAEVAP